MNPIERAAIPSGFLSMPAHLDHSRLAVIDKLAREWGLSVDVHKNVKILGGDNGEQILSVYHVENEKRKKHILYLKNGRCMCELCAGAPDKSTGDNNINNNNNISSTTKKVVPKKKRKRKDPPKELPSVALPAPMMPPLPFPPRYSNPFTAASSTNQNMNLNMIPSPIMMPSMNMMRTNMMMPCTSYRNMDTNMNTNIYTNMNMNTNTNTNIYTNMNMHMNTNTNTNMNMTPSYCCERYRTYMESNLSSNRKGRPPHTPQCTFILNIR